MTIGTREHAALALEGSIPLIGEGCTREAYLFDNVVYKVELAIGANHDEFTNAARVRSTVPFPFVVPDMELYYIGSSCVLAMPFIDGQATGECIGEWLGTGCDCDGACMSPEIADMAKAINGDSLSWGNTILKDGLYYLIDFDAVEFSS